MMEISSMLTGSPRSYWQGPELDFIISLLSTTLQKKVYNSFKCGVLVNVTKFWDKFEFRP